MKEYQMIENVEELIAFIIDNPHHSDTRWSLDDRSNRTWDDPEAGSKWLDASPRYVSSDVGEDAVAAYEKAEDEWRAARPSEHTVETWTLEYDKGDKWHSHGVHVSPELGHELSKIWKSGPAYRGAHYNKRVGTMTISGMLKRLGAGDMSDRIETAKRIIKERTALRNRNAFRRHVAEQARDLLKTMQRGTEQGVVWPLTISELAMMDADAYKEDEASVK